FDYIARDVDVLNASIGEIDLLAEEEAPTHRDAFIVEAIAHRPEANEIREKDDGEQDESSERYDDVISQQRVIGACDGGGVEYRVVGHEAVPRESSWRHKR